MAEIVERQIQDVSVTRDRQSVDIPEDQRHYVNHNGRRTEFIPTETESGRASTYVTGRLRDEQGNLQKAVIVGNGRGAPLETTLQNGHVVPIPQGMHSDDVRTRLELGDRGNLDMRRRVEFGLSGATSPDTLRQGVLERGGDDVGRLTHPRPAADPHSISRSGADGRHATEVTIDRNRGSAHNTGVLRRAGTMAALGAVAYFGLRGEFAQAAGYIPVVGPMATTALEGGSVGEIVQAGVETIPVAGPMIQARREGAGVMETVLRGAEDTGLVGMVAGSGARDGLRAMGVQGVEPSLMERAGQSLIGARPQDEFDQIYARLPNQPTGVPEVDALIEQRNMVQQAEENLAGVNRQTGGVGSNLPTQRIAAQRALDGAQEGYARQYEEMTQNGGLNEVRAYLNRQTLEEQNRPQGPAQQTPEQAPASQQFMVQQRAPGAGAGPG